MARVKHNVSKRPERRKQMRETWHENHKDSMTQYAEKFDEPRMLPDKATGQSIKGAIRRNGQKMCQHCKAKPRYLLTRYCLSCHSRWKRTGDVSFKSRLLREKEFEIERAEVWEALRLNRTHLMVRQSLNFLDALLLRATRTGVEGLNHVANRYIRRIAESEPDLMELLSLLAAVALKYRREGSPFVSDENYRRTLAFRFVRFAKGQGVNLQTTAMRQLSKYLDAKLGTFFIWVWRGCDMIEAESRKRDKEMQVKFRVSL